MVPQKTNYLYKISLIIIALLILTQAATSQNYNRQQQKPRHILTNSIFQNQPIQIEIDIFNTTASIFNKTVHTVYSQKLQEQIIEVPIQIFQTMENVTMKVDFITKDLYSDQKITIWTGQANLTKYKKISKMSSQEYFASGQIGSTNSNNQKGNYSLHIAQNFNILILHSNVRFPAGSQQLNHFRKMNFKISEFEFNGKQYEAKYTPRLDISQLHIPYKYYKPISGLLALNGSNNIQEQTNSQQQALSVKNQQMISQNQLNAISKIHMVKIHIFPYDLFRFMVFYQMFDPSMKQQMVSMNPLLSLVYEQQSLDDMKELLFTNNIYILILTITMTFAKTILQVFALKNQLKVWNQIQKNKGLSIKILYTDFVFLLVFFLYLVDNESNLMVTVPMLFSIGVTLWKIKKTIYIQKLNSFPYVKFKHYDWCKNHAKIDSEGVTYMYYGLAILFIVYILYELIFQQSVSSALSYSSILQKVVFFLGMAGFIRMTPQLYINYKLKSVDHLPWRTLIYRFIETIIDDFYVFLVTTPILHKIMVFREDVIFLLYLYQRVIYKTDPNRIGTAGGMVISKNKIQQIQKDLSSKQLKRE